MKYDAMNEIEVKLAFATRLTIKVSPTSCCWTKSMTSSLAQLETTIPFLNQVLSFYFFEVYMYTYNMQMIKMD